MPVSTALAPVLSGAAPSAPVCWLSVWVPPAEVPICSVVWPAVPTQVFFSSIEPRWRVLVKVQRTSSPLATATPSSASGVTLASPPSLMPLSAVPPPAPLSLKQASEES